MSMAWHGMAWEGHHTAATIETNPHSHKNSATEIEIKLNEEKGLEA